MATLKGLSSLSQLKGIVPQDDTFYNPYGVMFLYKETQGGTTVIIGDSPDEVWKIRVRKETALLGKIVSLKKATHSSSFPWEAKLEGGYVVALFLEGFGSLAEVSSTQSVDCREGFFTLYIRLAKAGYIEADVDRLERLLEAERRLWEAQEARTKLINELGGEVRSDGSYEDYHEWWEVEGIPFPLSREV